MCVVGLGGCGVHCAEPDNVQIKCPSFTEFLFYLSHRCRGIKLKSRLKIVFWCGANDSNSKFIIQDFTDFREEPLFAWNRQPQRELSRLIYV